MPKKVSNYLKSYIQGELGILSIAFIVIFVIMSFSTPVFFTKLNLMNVLRQISLVAIAGVGLSCVILLGEIDLSIGSSQAIVGLTAVTVLNATGNIFIAFISAVLLGALIGLGNGLLVTHAKIDSLIATLATMSILRGIAMIVTKAVSVQSTVKEFQKIGAGNTLGLPNPVLIMIVVFAVFYYILKHTKFGRYIYAIGGNQKAAALAGLPVVKIKLIVYLIEGALVATSAFILASRMNSGQPNAGVGFEMEVISAVILGGISMAGGTGKLVGAFLGMLILGVVSNGLVLMNVSSFYQQIVRGLVIILAVYMDGKRRRNKQKKLLSNQ